jgi:hypothetical protein
MGLKLEKKEVSDPYKEMEDQTKRFKERDAARNKRFNEEVEAVMEGLNVPKNEAEEIVRKKDERVLRDFMVPSEKEIRKDMRQKGQEVNKGGLLKKKKAKNMMGGGKVYSRGSRKAKYNG